MKYDKKVPPALLELQKWMGGMLKRPLRKLGRYDIPLYDKRVAKASENWITPGPQLSAAQRIGIYNQQFWFRLFGILQTTFPTLYRLFGAEDFNREIAEPYLLSYFPDSWSLAFLGGNLPRWIEENYREDDFLLIHQAALIDEACDRLFFGKAMPFLDLAVLPEIATLPLVFQPYVDLFELKGDFFAFRKEIIQQPPEYWLKNDLPAIDASRKRYVLFYRQGFDLVEEELSPAEWVLMKQFKTPVLLEKALEVLSSDNAPNVASWFKRWVEKGILTAAVSREERGFRKSSRAIPVSS